MLFREVSRLACLNLDKQLTLKAGDRLDLPAGTVHDAHVGAQGVVCLEAHKD